MIKDSGERTKFPSGALRDMHTGKGRMDLLPWLAIMEVSKHCEAGALKYGEHTMSIEYLQKCLVKLVNAKNSGYVTKKDIADALRSDYKLINNAE